FGQLHHHLLRLWRTLRQHHQPARLTADSLWLQRDDVGAGLIASWGLCDRYAAYRGRRSVWWHRRPLSDGRGSDDDGPGELMDGTPQFVHQPVASGLAEGGGDRGTLDAVRASE